LRRDGISFVMISLIIHVTSLETSTNAMGKQETSERNAKWLGGLET